MSTSAEVRRRFVRELRLDLVGPRNDDPELAQEVLPEPPSRWYLTGFLVPLGAPPRQKEVDSQEEMDEAEPSGGDDDQTPERTAGRKSRLPSSIGISVLVEAGTPPLRATVRWGDYRRELAEEGVADTDDQDGTRRWRREPREAAVEMPLQPGRAISLEGSGGLEIVRHVRNTKIRTARGEREVVAVSLFVVNRRVPVEEPGREDEASAFQAEIEVEAERPFVDRGDVKGQDASDPDARIGDLHYRDVVEWAVGHNTSVAAVLEDGTCRRVRTAWMPEAFVPRMVPGEVEGVERNMERLGTLEDSAAACAALGRLPKVYEDWIEAQRGGLEGLSERRREVADALISEAGTAAGRIRDGIARLDDPKLLDAFRTMNRAIAAALRRRRSDQAPAWYPFQLAFILLNLPGLVEPAHGDRRTVDLLFFPTGGGKTEAYLGLASFVMVYRRLVHGSPGGCGLAVLMRYTLRLLTLDQLGRASAVVCALELERRSEPGRLGEWPFEIGLWVGRGATPNRMGAEGDRDERPGPQVQARQQDLSADPDRVLPVVRYPLRPEQLPAGSACQATHRPPALLRQPALRVLPPAGAPGSDRGRADLPTPAGLPDRHRRQVRGHALGRRGGRVLRARRHLRRPGVLRGGGASRRPSNCRSPAAA